MKNVIGLVCFLLASGFCFAQDGRNMRVQMRGGSSVGFSYESFPFPSGIKLFTLEKEKLELELNGVSLVMVWSLCCGAEPEVWSRAWAMEQEFKERGLKSIWINFENGSELRAQLRDVKKFLKDVSKPDHLYIDALGYSVDLLQVPGFPTYYLVDDQGRVVFRTNGKDEEGLSILRSEIEARLGY